MGKVLVIAEKPSVAKDLARVLNCKKKERGYFHSDDYVVSWAIGHLVTLWEPEDYDPKYKKWTFQTLPIAPAEIKLKAARQTKEQFDLLKKMLLSDKIDSIICATDSGREGELIFRYIYSLAGATKPFRRLWISSMTDKAIKAGFENLKDGAEYDNLYLSAKCRSEADWLVGMNASRAFTLRYDALLSIGRVQTPTLAIIVNRQKEINEFVPRDYWEVSGLFAAPSEYAGKWIDLAENETKIFDRERAEAIREKVAGMEGAVKSVELEEKSQPAPLLYDLTELQRDCNRKFGLSASRALEIAQSLYEKRKAITYPRTDSRYLTEDMKPAVASTVKKLKIPPYEKFAEYLGSLSQLPFSKRIIDASKVSDHHAIIPTDSAPKPDSFSDEERKVYDLIARRFFAVFYPNYTYNVTKVITEVENEMFISKGMVVTRLGWMELYGKEDAEAVILPDLKEGDAVSVTEATVEQKRTQPPKAYNEAALLSAMENAGRFIEDEALREKLKDSGLGTPATRAAIIERLIKVGYVERKGKTLIPTEKAMLLIEAVPPELKSPETTGRWEKGLSSIAKGKMGRDRFMESIGRYVDYLIDQAKNARNDIVIEDPRRKAYRPAGGSALGKCPDCGEQRGGLIYENSKAFFCSNWKSGCKFTVWKEDSKRGSVIDAAKMRETLKGKGSTV